jgi:two-component system, NarL family, nitrate/nitrite response regulator NarL
MAIPLTVLLVDDTAAIRRSLRFFIGAETDLTICGEADNGRAAIEMVRELHPDVVLMDLSMPVMNGLEAAREIRTIAPKTHIFMFTLYAYPELVREAKKLGVRKVISKLDGDPANVVGAIRSVLAA